MTAEHDIYFQKALEEGYLARSAYKLLQIDEIFDIFEGVTRAIDLCSAPGSWTQVIYNKLHNVLNNYDPSKLNPNVKIVSVDMMQMDQFPGVIHLQADISQYSTMKAILDEFDSNKADIIVCDGAIDVVGMKQIDYFMHHRIFLSALYITLNALRIGGSFVMKIFIDKGHERIVQKLGLFFQYVTIVKPHCSRNKEAFAVCRNYTPLAEFDPVQLTPYVELRSDDFSKLKGIHRKLIPYLCADCYKTEFISSGCVDVSTDGCNFGVTLNAILNSVQSDVAVLKKRMLQCLPVYQITKDNNLIYDDEFSNHIFKGFAKQTDTDKDEMLRKINEICSEKDDSTVDAHVILQSLLNNDHIQNDVGSNENDNQLGPVDDETLSYNPFKPTTNESNVLSSIDCAETIQKQSTISSALGERIKTLELENRGKFSGLGFNLEEWTFFTKGFGNSFKNEEFERIHKDFEQVYMKLKAFDGVKCCDIKEVVVESEEMKKKVRQRFVEDQKIEGEK